MSESSVKKYKRAMRKEIKAKEREETALIIYKMLNLPLKQRIKFAWRIIKGSK